MSDVIETVLEPEPAIAWPAVIAGALAALALSVALAAIAAGFGFAAAPWPGSPGDHTDFTPIAGAVMLVVQVLAAGLGGYLAGRLRTRWSAIHEHEAHFRDTAHGLLVWAASTLLSVLLVALMLAPAATETVQAAGNALTPAEAQRAKDIAAQVSMFMGIGLLLSAFTAAVAAAIGGQHRHEMYRRYAAAL